MDGPLLLGDHILQPRSELVESDHGVLVGRRHQPQLCGPLSLLGTHGTHPAPNLVQGRELGLITCKTILAIMKQCKYRGLSVVVSNLVVVSRSASRARLTKKLTFVVPKNCCAIFSELEG